MDTQEITRTCKQCHKEIALANFALHETHCSRFLCLCPDCKETVPKEQLSEHWEEQHSQTTCSKCHQKMERCQLMDHQSDECVERLQECHFCDLELPWKQLADHSLVCGSRTELCGDCRCYVRLRDQPQHGLTCLATNTDTSPHQSNSSPWPKVIVCCRGCKALIPAEDIATHELGCVLAFRCDRNEEMDAEEEEGDTELFPLPVNFPQLSSSNEPSSIIARTYRGPRINGDDQDHISTCRHCHLALPVSMLAWHEAKCEINNHVQKMRSKGYGASRDLWSAVEDEDVPSSLI